MSEKHKFSRRQFVASASAVAAFSSIAGPKAFATPTVVPPGSPQAQVPLVDSPTWRDQGVENLAKSPHAKLRNIPVRAVTIHDGFWGKRRETNVTKSVPT